MCDRPPPPVKDPGDGNLVWGTPAAGQRCFPKTMNCPGLAKCRRLLRSSPAARGSERERESKSALSNTLPWMTRRRGIHSSEGSSSSGTGMMQSAAPTERNQVGKWLQWRCWLEALHHTDASSPYDCGAAGIVLAPLPITSNRSCSALHPIRHHQRDRPRGGTPVHRSPLLVRSFAPLGCLRHHELLIS